MNQAITHYINLFEGKFSTFLNKKLHYSKYWSKEIEATFLKKIAYDFNENINKVKNIYHNKSEHFYLQKNFLGCHNLGISIYNIIN